MPLRSLGSGFVFQVIGVTEVIGVQAAEVVCDTFIINLVISLITKIYKIYILTSHINHLKQRKIYLMHRHEKFPHHIYWLTTKSVHTAFFQPNKFLLFWNEGNSLWPIYINTNSLSNEFLRCMRYFEFASDFRLAGFTFCIFCEFLSEAYFSIIPFQKYKKQRTSLYWIYQTIKPVLFPAFWSASFVFNVCSTSLEATSLTLNALLPH